MYKDRSLHVEQKKKEKVRQFGEKPRYWDPTTMTHYSDLVTHATTHYIPEFIDDERLERVCDGRDPYQGAPKRREVIARHQVARQ